jgi:uncharacterized protein (TIGR02594 family)
MLMQAVALYGTVEFAGKANNPIILGWAAEIGYEKVYKHDSIPWCGLGMAICAKRAGWDYNPGGNALGALNWAKWGNAVPNDKAMLGDLGVWRRKGGGHVGIIIGYDVTGCYHVLGFNQLDSCSIVRKPIKGIVAVRRAPWRQAQPPNVRRILLSPGGAAVSTKED